jgi:hypothetical protein
MEKAVKIFLYGVVVLIFITLMSITFCNCTKQEPVRPTPMTGVWHRDNGATYSFFEDSRFQQSDKPGAQWVWIKKGNQVYLYGNLDRFWTVDFVGRDEVIVIEDEKFTITRK